MQDQAVIIREMAEADLPGNHQLQHLQMQYHLDWLGPIDYEWIDSEACTQRTRNFIENDDHLAIVAEQGFGSLRAPILRVTTPDTQIPFAPEMESGLFPNKDRVVAAVKQVLDA